METTKDKEILIALKALRDAVNGVANLWDHTGTNMIDGYPTCLPSFDEFQAEVIAWHETQSKIR